MKQFKEDSVPQLIVEREEEAKKRQAIGHFNAPQYKENPVGAQMPKLEEKGRSDEQAGKIMGVNLWQSSQENEIISFSGYPEMDTMSFSENPRWKRFPSPKMLHQR